MKPIRLFALGLLGCALAAGAALAEPVHTTGPTNGDKVLRFDTNFIPEGSDPLFDGVPTTKQFYAGQVPMRPAGSSPTNVIFLNKCTGGCLVHAGNTTDSRTDTWNSADMSGTLTAYPRSATHWNTVLNCVKTTFAPFNVQITDVDPGNTPHYEVMVAGNACAILSAQSGCQGIGGVAQGTCFDIGNCPMYVPNALSFDFATSWNNYPDPDNEDCSTIAQEIAHTWALDHVVDSHDPMTYNPYDGQHLYHNAEKCGSDCDPAYCQTGSGLCSPYGLTCTGTSDANATHTCFGSGTTTQDELSVILSLFGSSAPDNVPPTVMITSPADGAAVMPKFQIQTTVNDNQGISKVDLQIDGTGIASLGSFPYTFTAPATLAMGNHTVTVTAYDIMGNMTSDSIMVHYGTPCTKPADCPNATDTCVSGRCIAGMGTPGGLGTACTTNDQCDSGSCASDGTQSVCVTSCDTSMNGCPSGFGCVPTMATGTAGVCFPGADSGGGGGCSSGSNGGGVAFFGLVLGLGALSRRRTARA